MCALGYLTTSILHLREFMPQYAIFVKNGDGGVSYLSTSILSHCEFMPHYGVFVMKGGLDISYLTTSILPLRETMPHYGIFVMIGGGSYKLSNQFYSAPSRNYAPLWYICHDWGWEL